MSAILPVTSPSLTGRTPIVGELAEKPIYSFMLYAQRSKPHVHPEDAIQRGRRTAGSIRVAGTFLTLLLAVSTGVRASNATEPITAASRTFCAAGARCSPLTTW